MQTADVCAVLGSEKQAACFYPSVASQPFMYLPFLCRRTTFTMELFICRLQLKHSTRLSDMREEIKMFQAVTELVGDLSNLIIRSHPVWAAADTLYGALRRIYSHCCKSRKIVQVGSFILKWEDIVWAKNRQDIILANSGSEISAIIIMS